ncbi:MAG TPA: extracellular solute-binding protein [Candidatus Eisenbacteria bacterium]|jgi:multiple sugar transport system substrate-binding protein|nr:extracellular solute-binding protein [Candidatus Eisenbacteria bacterium]
MGAEGHRRIASRAGRFGLAILVLALALVLGAGAGCGRRGSGKTPLVFWQFSPLATIQPVLDKFRAENPGIDLQVEQLTWQSGREKIVAAIAAGRAPDVCELGSTFLPGLVADSTLDDLTDSTADLRSALVGWDGVSYRGRSYAIPWMLGTRALYFNEDLFRRAGLDPTKPPDTWDELYRAVHQIAERVPDAKGFGMNAGEREILIKKFMPFAWGNGGDILDSTLTHSVINSHQNREALRFYLSLKPYSLLDRQEMHEQAFSKGRLGIVISGSWLIRTLQKTAPDLHYRVTLMPRPEPNGGTHASFAGAEVLGIFRGSKHRAEAMRLARFLVRPENAMPLYLATGNAFPAAASAAADSYFVTHPMDGVFLEQLKSAKSPPLHPRWVEIEEIVNDELEQAIYDKKRPEQALADADARITQVLAPKP